MRLHLLDDVTWDGHPVPGERTHALLRALADAGQRGVSDGALIEELWPDEAPANPTKALQVVVSRARAATSAEAIERTERGYRLALPVEDVDVWAARPVGLSLAAEGRYDEALPLLEQAGSDDEVVAALLRSIAAVQGVPAALERFEGYRNRLADHLGVDPSPALRALHSELLARDRPVRAGVRFDADTLVGRESDIAALATLVRGHRLVSIVGAGGLGKTRLAHLVARTAEQPVVQFVELVSVTDGHGVAVEVADALGARDAVTGRTSRTTTAASGRGDAIARIVDLVGTVPMLLVLDNCEQVVGAVADLVARLLASTPHLTVLTTTRVPLGLAAERVYQLPELSGEDASELFVERATSARPSVVLDPERVRSLVARLDGLPLAIELAAAKVRSMSVEEIERRLENRFELLRGGSRDAPERHQTLLAVIDWSWNLLTEEQRLALRRVSVFRDGFSVDAATSVIGYDATEVVAALVEQSLVVVAEHDDGLRYHLLETVREFGRMQLVDAGDDLEAAKALRDWAVERSLDAGSRLFSRDQVAMMRLLRRDEGNLVEALRQANAAGDAEAVAAILGALVVFWQIEGAHLKVLNIGRSSIDALVSGALGPAYEDPARSALSQVVLASRMFTGTPYEPAERRLRELGAEGAGPRMRGLTTMILALAELPDGSRAQTLDALTEDPDPVVAQFAAMWASQMYENMGDLERSRQEAEKAFARLDDEDGPWSRAVVNAHLASLELQAGNRPQARARAEAALPTLAALGAMEDWAQVMSVVALVAIDEGDLEGAQRIFDELNADERLQSGFGGAISQLCGAAELLLARGQVDEGLTAYRSASAELTSRGIQGLGLPSGFEPFVLFPQAGCLAAHMRFGRSDDVRDLHDDLLVKCAGVLAGSDEYVDYPIAGTTVFVLACWELLLGDRDAGARLLAYSERFSFNRMLPSIDGAWAESLADPDALAIARKDVEGRPARDLRPDAAALLARL